MERYVDSHASLERAPCLFQSTDQALLHQAENEELARASCGDTNSPVVMPGNREIRDSANIRKLRSYLNLKARVTISDKRVFVGYFVCIDKLKNVILTNSEEFTPAGGRRRVGSVVIPGRHLVKVEIEDLDTSTLYT